MPALAIYPKIGCEILHLQNCMQSLLEWMFLSQIWPLKLLLMCKPEFTQIVY